MLRSVSKQAILHCCKYAAHIHFSQQQLLLCCLEPRPLLLSLHACAYDQHAMPAACTGHASLIQNQQHNSVVSLLHSQEHKRVLLGSISFSACFVYLCSSTDTPLALQLQASHTHRSVQDNMLVTIRLFECACLRCCLKTLILSTALPIRPLAPRPARAP